mmetsp:Transcript_63509/g.189236  ORF Transcript_63509/g.189236 Transcript_63509/m.189236 type:complete len:278 (+) Transcript_63509:24-857(+)
MAGSGKPRLLGAAEEVPEYQRRPYICNYYRLERPCLRHFCRCHNELGNIWTHVVAFACTLYRLAVWLSSQDAIMAMGWPRALYAFGVTAYFVAALVVFGASVQFHWRMCSPKREFLCWRCLDQSCCLALVVAGFFAGIPMGFHCTPWLQAAYLGQSLLVLLATSAVAWAAPRENAGLLSCSIMTGALSALIPAAHWLSTSREGRRAGGPSLTLAMLSGTAAAAVFVTLVPERLAPGRFDLVGSSHQIWHVLIFIAVAAYGDALAAVFDLTGSAQYCL